MKRVAFLGTALLALAAGSPSLAADMPLKAPPAPVVDPWLWTGFYVGANGGYSWGRVNVVGDATLQTTVFEHVFRTASGPNLPALPGFPDITTVTTTSLLATGKADVDGWLGGVQAGYNWQAGRLVLGVEADIQATGQDGGVIVCVALGCPAGSVFATANYSLDWFGTLRGRVGYALDRFLIYGTGGLAVGKISTDYVLGFNGGPQVLFSDDVTRTGWVVGGGVEAFVTRNWTVKGEYLYMDLGDISVFGGGATTSNTIFIPDVPVQGFSTQVTTTNTLSGFLHSSFIDHILRLGVNYKF
jgi:outer membrane immunogenic protein